MFRNIQVLRADPDAAAAFDALPGGVLCGVRSVSVPDLRLRSEDPGVVEDPDKAGDGQFQRTFGKTISASGTRNHGILIQERPEIFKSFQFSFVQGLEIFHEGNIFLHLFHGGDPAQNGIHALQTGGEADRP